MSSGSTSMCLTDPVRVSLARPRIALRPLQEAHCQASTASRTRSMPLEGSATPLPSYSSCLPRRALPSA